jgi:hypothetical protein
VSGYDCIQGACAPPITCQGGTKPTDCAGKCVDVWADTNNCGACGAACVSGYTCNAGKCITGSSCGGTLSNCGGKCVDEMNDSNNCGGCGLACQPQNHCANGSCVQASCLPDNNACTSDGECCSLLCAGDGLCGCIPSGYGGCTGNSDCCSNDCDIQSGACL